MTPFRLRQEHMASEQKVRASREMRKNFRDDVCTLSRSFHETCSLKENAEKHLDKVKKMYTEVAAHHRSATTAFLQIQKDWQRKLKDRRKEVRRIRRLQSKERDREERRRKKRLEVEEAELAMKAEKERERKELEGRIQSLEPKIEAMEAMWGRVCSVSKSTSCEQVIEFWNELKDKIEGMKELVRVKEQEHVQAQSKLREIGQANVRTLEAGSEQPHDEHREGDDQIATDGAASVVSNARIAVDPCVRLEQGLRVTLRRFSSSRDDDDDLNDCEDYSLELASLFEIVSKQITLLKSEAKTDAQQGRESTSSNPDAALLYRRLSIR